MKCQCCEIEKPDTTEMLGGFKVCDACRSMVTTFFYVYRSMEKAVELVRKAKVDK